MLHDPPHLAIAAFAQTDGEPGVLALHRVEPRLDRTVPHPLDRHPACQAGKRALIGRAMHPHAVAAEPAGGRQLQLACQRAIVGEQQQPFAGEIEPSDADDARQMRRQALEHGRAALGVAMRGHQAVGLVVTPQPRALGRGDHGAVHLHGVVGLHEGRGMRHGGAVQADLARFQQFLGIPPARHAGPREPLGDAFATRRLRVTHRRRSGRRRCGGRPGR